MQLDQIFRLFSVKASYKMALCGALVWAADFLFYGEQAGWTFGLFGLLLLTGVLGSHHGSTNHKYTDGAAYAVLGLTFAFMEAPSTLAGCLYGVSILALTLLPKIKQVDDIRVIAKNVVDYAIISWWRLFSDSWVMFYARKRWNKTHASYRAVIRHWLLPIGLSCIFVMLFAQANPIITGWVDRIQWQALTEYFSIKRAVFWLCVASGCWALIRPKFKQRKSSAYGFPPKQEFTFTALLFNERSILTSLILFNGLFFIQNALDIAFLWSGAASLPQGMTHAQYAHQGAYPLIATALLAAAFVLIAFKPGSASERMPTIRLLVDAWVGQNIFLVLSSMTRLLGYIEEYSLTYLRVAALVWMGLVALGLVLIVARIHLRKANVWLINANSLALYATLYVCCFINFGCIIANYNVRHAYEVDKNNWAILDIGYIRSEIGVDAIPALLWFEQHCPDSRAVADARMLRTELQSRLTYSMQDWRQWTFRNFRLSQVIFSATSN